MSNRSLTKILSLACLAGLAMTACDADGEPDPVSERSVVFDAELVNAELREDPDALFFVDLRDDTVYTFDQRVESLDYDHFLVQCPSMVAPVPMLAFVEILGGALHIDSELWMMGAWDPDATTLRAASGTFPEPQDGMNCTNKICDSNGQDCTWECSY